MSDFIFSFILSNFYLGLMIGLLFLVKRVFRCWLSAQMQYRLWHILFILLCIPLLPLKAVKKTFHAALLPAFHLFRSYLLLLQLKQSTLPMENETILHLYEQCKKELKIKQPIPLSSSDYIKSPVIAGIFKPHIYMPLYAASQYSIEEIRFMLLHELGHYKQKDLLWNSLTNIVGIFYWFHPLVHFAKKTMRNEQELSCDAFVLSYISKNSYTNYGNTIIACAQNVSLSHAPFALSMSSTYEQLKGRITHILTYEKLSWRKGWKGLIVCIITVILFVGFTLNLSAYSISSGDANYRKKISGNSQTSVEENFSDYFEETEGCFVLFDSKNNTWHIYFIDKPSFFRIPPLLDFMLRI